MWFLRIGLWLVFHKKYCGLDILCSDAGEISTPHWKQTVLSETSLKSVVRGHEQVTETLILLFTMALAMKLEVSYFSVPNFHLQSLKRQWKSTQTIKRIRNSQLQTMTMTLMSFPLPIPAPGIWGKFWFWVNLSLNLDWSAVIVVPWDSG
jgi:hypothetical protein